MILPIGDSPNPAGFRPYVTWLLIAANVLVYLAYTLPLGVAPIDPTSPEAQDYLRFLEGLVPSGQLAAAVQTVSQWDLVVFEYGYRPSTPQALDLFTSMFMHAGFAHLFGNMLFLWIYGDNVEHRLGRLGFLAMYLGTGVAATLSFAWLAGDVDTPLVGASGAISGVLGMYFLCFPRNAVRMLIGFPPIFFNVILLPAWMVLGAYVLFSNLLPLLSGAESSVAYGAHLGGFAAGMALALPLALAGLAMPGGAPSSGGARQALDDAKEAERGARPAHAHQILMNALRRASGTDRARLQLALGQLLARHGRATEAYQWLFRASQNPATAVDARRTMTEMGLDPRLVSRSPKL